MSCLLRAESDNTCISTVLRMYIPLLAKPYLYQPLCTAELKHVGEKNHNSMPKFFAYILWDSNLQQLCTYHGPRIVGCFLRQFNVAILVAGKTDPHVHSSDHPTIHLQPRPPYYVYICIPRLLSYFIPCCFRNVGSIKRQKCTPASKTLQQALISRTD